MKKIFALCLVSFTLSACVMNEELDSVIQEQTTPTVRVSNVQNQEARSIPISASFSSNQNHFPLSALNFSLY